MQRVLLVLCAVLAVGCRPHPAENAILISIDTLRPDHLGLYGHERPTSPNLDRFAAGGAVFEQALSTAPWTLPAHASMLTGRYPSRHGLRTDQHRLRADVATLADCLHPRGFVSAAFVNSAFLLPRSGLNRGFDTYELVPEKETPRGRAALITRLALDWLEAHRRERFFLFLHYFDVHSDYASLERYERRFAPEHGRLSGRTLELRLIRAGLVSIGAEDAEHLARLYDAGIRQLDDNLAPLLAWLEGAGRLEDTVVALTSDHGEEFLEHGSVLHGHTHYEELLRVPLVLRGASVPAGARIRTAVSIADVMPTLLGVLGVPAPDGLDGRDLRGLWEAPGAMARDRPLFAETSAVHTEGLSSVRMGRHKLIHDLRTDRSELYDLEQDPLEGRDLASERLGVLEELRALLRELAGESVPSEQAPPRSPAVEERLRALGYL